jgi:electron transfer flavoprotein beta subunit
VFGIQAARQAPRYAPISRIRQAQQAGGIAEVAAELPEAGAGLTVRKLSAPEKTGQAEMLAGDAGDVADRIISILRERGLVG